MHDSVTVMLWYGGALGAGLACGALFFLIFKKIVPPGTAAEYFKGLIENFFGLLKEDDRFWASYKAIVLGSLRFAGQQAAGLVLALVPLAVFFWAAGLPLLAIWDRPSPIIVAPREAGRVVPSLPGDDGPVLILNGASRIALDGKPLKYVVCPSGDLSCSSMVLLGFRTLAPGKGVRADGKIIVRHARGGRNIFWPYVNDLEFAFYLGLLIVSLVLPFLKKKAKRQTAGKDQEIAAVDYMFMCLARYHAGASNRLGRWEGKWFALRLSKKENHAPIFVTGLARAGSTILLELLAGAEGVATHRYRDFPFLMTPILWNGFVSAFSAKQELRERAHQDRILINRESPEAFEEPIWQHYFPELHAPDSVHVLTAEHANPDFERFYDEHIRKILFIRKGRRYLSKGNYNVARVAYLLKLYPEARFVIPVRHPLSHIYSLCRQHEKFMTYAKENPRVCEYLEAAGHYEFGPQRKPVCITIDGAKRILEAWRQGDTALGYAVQWAEIYRHVREAYLSRPELARRIYILRYEDLCAAPAQTMEKVLAFLELGDRNVVNKAAGIISPPSYTQALSPEEAERCWQAVEEIARHYDYCPQ